VCLCRIGVPANRKGRILSEAKIKRLRALVNDVKEPHRHTDEELEGFLEEANNNLNLAAAKVWDEIASECAHDYDVSSDGRRLSRNQKFNNAVRQAAFFRSRIPPSLIHLSGE